jgi:hypothetical protein
MPNVLPRECRRKWGPSCQLGKRKCPEWLLEYIVEVEQLVEACVPRNRSIVLMNGGFAMVFGLFLVEVLVVGWSIAA